MRAARLATIALLFAGAIVLVALVAWSFHIRSTSFEAGHVGVRRGLELMARLDTRYLSILSVAGIVALALAIAILRKPSRWQYLATAIGSALSIAGVWFAQRVIVHLEDPRFAKKSPWVKASMMVATTATIYLVLLTAAAVTAWITISRDRPIPDRR